MYTHKCPVHQTQYLFYPRDSGDRGETPAVDGGLIRTMLGNYIAN